MNAHALSTCKRRQLFKVCHMYILVVLDGDTPTQHRCYQNHEAQRGLIFTSDYSYRDYFQNNWPAGLHIVIVLL